MTDADLKEFQRKVKQECERNSPFEYFILGGLRDTLNKKHGQCIDGLGCFQRVYLKCLSRKGLMIAWIDVNRTVENIELMKNLGNKYFRAEDDEAAIKECLAQINREIERRKTVL